jgi:hypothetical protein
MLLNEPQVKMLEIRDHLTFIPMLAVNMNPANEGQRYLLRRCGYPCDARPNIVLTRLQADGSPATNDPYGWEGHGARTIPTAHKWIIEHWDELKDGDVVDYEFIVGFSASPKISERVEWPL